jgi:hypothetical protein
MSLILGILDSGGAAAGAGGSYESIATVTVGSGGAANVEFTSIPATYTHLQIRAIARTDRAATGEWLEIQFNSDTASNYSDHYFAGNGSTASAGGQANVSYMEVNRFPAASSTASIFGAFVTDILDYANTNKNKTIRNLGGNDQNGSGEIHLGSGNWRSTNAITSIKILPGGGTNLVQYSQFALYGIKGV